MNKPPIIFTFFLLLSSCFAERSSGNYSINDSLTSGNISTNQNLVINCSIGETIGLISGNEKTVKNGYIGQLYNVKGLVIVGDTNINERGTNIFRMVYLLDDNTKNLFGGATWRIINGPVNIFTNNEIGLIVADSVYKDESAVISSSFNNKTSSVGLLIKNINDDDLYAYGYDGIKDTWQVEYFGINNILGYSTSDPDNDLQNNYLEYVYGTNPTNSNDYFDLWIEKGGSNRVNIMFFPIRINREYLAESSQNLLSNVWVVLSNVTIITQGELRTVNTVSTNRHEFYRIKIKYQ